MAQQLPPESLTRLHEAGCASQSASRGPCGCRSVSPSPREPERTNFVQVGEPICTCADARYSGCLVPGHPRQKPIPAAPTTSENIATSDDLNRIAYQTAPLTIAMGDKLSGLADALDALAAAVQGCRKLVDHDICYPDDLCRNCTAAKESAIGQLLAGGTR